MYSAARELVVLNEGEFRLFLAESCTAGAISSAIGAVPGASSFLWGSAVVYANEAKTMMLGVEEGAIATYGAVSDIVVEEMLRGALRMYPVSIACAVSGIAGPHGGTKEKPVGLVYIGVAYGIDGKLSYCVERNEFHGSRKAVQKAATEGALSLIGAALTDMKKHRV